MCRFTCCHFRYADSKNGVTCCRRRSEHQSHIQSTCPGFSDVLCEVPTLLAMVPSSDWPALLGCSKQLRYVVHSSVQATRVTHEEDVTLVLEGSWPQLGLIKLEEVAWFHYSSFQSFQSCKQQLPSDSLARWIPSGAVQCSFCCQTFGKAAPA